jgi:hypothetical protein
MLGGEKPADQAMDGLQKSVESFIASLGIRK